MRILYLHGLASSKEANTANVLRDNLFEDIVLAIDIPMEPYEALKTIFKTITEFHPHMIIGNSLGGFYAQFFEGPLKILINPALRPDKELKDILGGYGEFPYLKDREEKTFKYDSTYESSFSRLRNQFEKVIKDMDHVRQTYAIFGALDTIVSDRDYFNKQYNPKHAITFNGEHRLTDDNIKYVLIPLINEIRSY